MYIRGLDCQWIDITNLAPGTYTVFVDGKGGSGTYNLDVYIDPTGASPGDRCSNPTFWATGTPSQTGSTCGLNNDVSGIGCEYVGSGNGPDTKVPWRAALVGAR